MFLLVFVFSDRSSIEYTMGNKLAALFTGLVSFSRTDEITRASFKITQIMQSDGVAIDVNSVEYLFGDVKKAFGEVAPGAKITEEYNN